MKLFFSGLVFLVTASSIFSQQLVYTPVNPAFGGNTFNYQWLLSSATAQNQFDNDKGNLFSSQSSLSSFTESLNRQLLSQLSTKLFGEQFGDGDLKPGTYVFGSMYLEVIQTSSGMMIKILNTSTGEQSEIVIPGANK
ncbi:MULTISPECIES: curli assembly protein CsgF [Chryseobacterium]|uniref:Curli production assembly/transport component CsgF n=1 Tax=Chryseobacterium taihuense TaxID=1141221 RepID=A0A1G9LKJ0_9FLAO|nr:MULTISPECIES: curli assembly protein CsgF [Chryseobacterium]QQV01277.1 curli assembly protein CsgF [Chryseobacterium sp. FDAARGOS 1104]SDL62509.1 curli production assembly/transport component CsgF [Chryseobacterium taihuense]VFB02129.1 curli assembly protein CsgF [Chryseobacterium taihuense]